MVIISADPGPVRNERELIAQLPLDAERARKPGCRTARQTRLRARSSQFAPIVAPGVDDVRHARHLAIDLSSAYCGLGRAGNIPTGDACVDAAALLKSLHQTPRDWLAQAFGASGQLVAFGRARVAGGRRVLRDELLDEPFAGLTPVRARQLAASRRARRDIDLRTCGVATASTRTLLRELPDLTVTLERGDVAPAVTPPYPQSTLENTI